MYICVSVCAKGNILKRNTYQPDAVNCTELQRVLTCNEQVAMASPTCDKIVSSVPLRLPSALTQQSTESRTVHSAGQTTSSSAAGVGRGEWCVEGGGESRREGRAGGPKGVTFNQSRETEERDFQNWLKSVKSKKRS